MRQVPWSVFSRSLTTYRRIRSNNVPHMEIFGVICEWPTGFEAFTGTVCSEIREVIRCVKLGLAFSVWRLFKPLCLDYQVFVWLHEPLMAKTERHWNVEYHLIHCSINQSKRLHWLTKCHRLYVKISETLLCTFSIQ